jgi:20S proteasome subunit alpha 7
MASSGAGYDLNVATFSPDGRLFQVEYAEKAVDNSGTAIGLRCKDGYVSLEQASERSSRVRS